ncbi:MAG: hypothetical protein ACM359_02370, partial [Bacillota bacterium]
PALKLAKRSAERIAYASNMRQLGTAFLMYAQENRGWLPFSANADFPLQEDWIHWQKGRDLSQSRILPYLNKSTKALQCPSGIVPRPGAYPYSYAVNQLIAGTGWVDWRPEGQSMHWFDKPPCNLLKVVQPSHKLLLGEMNSDTIFHGAWRADSFAEFPPQGSFVIHLLSVRHDQPHEYTEYTDDQVSFDWYWTGQGNVIFADGHYGMLERWVTLDPYYCNPRYAGPLTRQKPQKR